MRVQSLANAGPIVGKKSDEKVRVGEPNDPLPLRLSLSFTCGAKGRLH